MGKTFIAIGILFIVAGMIIHFGSKFFPFGNLPGDIKVQKENFTFYFPVVTCIVISLVLSFLLNLFNKR